MSQRHGLSFPKKILWGVSTSAYLVEGGAQNQWSRWERETASVRAAQAPYQYDSLDNWSVVKKAAQSARNYISGRAVDHYARFADDLDLVQQLHMNAFRFGVEWSRIEPSQGGWDAAAVEHYKAVVAACKKRGIEPIVTLFDMTLPLWFAELGGFEKASNIRYFVTFATHILAELGKDVRFVITMNEPDVYARQSYEVGEWPPQQTNRVLARRVLRHLVVAHREIAKALHDTSRRYRVSVAKNYISVYSGDDARLSLWSTRWMQYRQNDVFLRRIRRHCDFIGVNFYTSERVYGYRVHNPNQMVSDVGWDMQPQRLQQVLEELYATYGLPIMVTGNGVADASDEKRVRWLTQTMIALQHSVDEGVELMGYLHDGLVDHFDWERGFWPKYGLYSVDRLTFRRVPRPSAVYLSKLLKTIRR